jgi:hypothetical protein
MVRVWVADSNIFKNTTYSMDIKSISHPMSRAPAPMKVETSHATVNANPYAMGTLSGMPNNMAPMYPMGATAAPMHAMQHMYTNMQQPQPQNPYGMQQQSVGAQPAHPGMQNVSVLDFKPDVLAQQQAAYAQQQYNAHLNSMAAAANPSLGVIGPDGNYMPATAATPGAMSPRFASNSYGSVGASAHQNGAYGSYGLHSHPGLSHQVPRPMNSPSYASSIATRAAMKDMIDERVDKAWSRKANEMASRSPATPTTESAFHLKSEAEQKRIVGKAVGDVMQKYKVEERDPAPRHLDSEIDDIPSRFQARGNEVSSRYHRGVDY